MFRTILICILLLIVLAIAPYLSQNHGLAEFTFGNYQVQVSLFTLAIAFIVLLVCLYLVEYIIRFVFKLVFGFFTGRRARLEKRAARQQEQGLRELIAGNYQKAQRLLSKSAKNAKDPVLNLSQTFDVALRNGDLVLAETCLEQAVKTATERDLNLVEVCKLKWFIAKQEFAKAKELVIPLKERLNSEEVNLLAIEVFIKTHSYAQLEDLLPSLLKRQYITQEQFNQYTKVCENGYMDVQLEQNGVDGLMHWWDNQLRKRIFNIVSRNILLEKLINLKEIQHAIDVAVGTFNRCKINDIENSNFIDLLEQIPVDNLNRDLSIAIEKKYTKFTIENQYRLVEILSHLYYRAANYTNSLEWSEKLLELEDKNHAQHNTNNMLLAQVLYRRLGKDSQLDDISKTIDGQLHLTYSSTENAEESESEETVNDGTVDAEAQAPSK